MDLFIPAYNVCNLFVSIFALAVIKTFYFWLTADSDEVLRPAADLFHKWHDWRTKDDRTDSCQLWPRLRDHRKVRTLPLQFRHLRIIVVKKKNLKIIIILVQGSLSKIFTCMHNYDSTFECNCSFNNMWISLI